MLKPIKNFILTNKTITFFLFFALICAFSYLKTLTDPEIIPGIEKWYNFCFQLSVGYIINFIFYLTQVYVPEQKRISSITRCIIPKLDSILHAMIEPLSFMSEVYLNKKSNSVFTSDDLKIMWSRLNTNDVVPILNCRTRKNITFAILLQHNINKIKDSKDKLFLYYSQYLSTDLIETLEAITDSNYFDVIEMACVTLGGSTFSDSDNSTIVILQYYELYNKLLHIKNSLK
ncbi:hypothetical protein [Clostridium butyricum]|uniref:hypothetical protein n=1 Tax=Clostridium butyricum TaxID=1492 RepID=UPI000404142D|nr:hypothetical protein [Clostridium butyricum]